MGYLHDAFNRFCRNKASIFGAVIVLILVLYAIFVPLVCSNSYTSNPQDSAYLQYIRLLPKEKAFETREMSEATYLINRAIGVETGSIPSKK